MSGIAGLYSRTGRGAVSRTDIARMLGAMPHRGPDGSSTWASGGVGLGHAMLRTTPESLSESLPRVLDGGNLVYTGDARIDNGTELREQLSEFASEHEGTIADSDLVIWAYRKWREKCVDHLIGDFAFALFDASIGGIFCARDHFGVKPFYYAINEEWFAFATEQKALFTLGWVDTSVNGARVEEMLVSLALESKSTFYRGIVRLPPAHCMVVGSEDVEPSRYWSLDPTHELKLPSDDDYAARLRELFEQAVQCRLRSAYPVGAYLSGGLDSSSIVSVAAPRLSERGQKLRTYSKLFPDVVQCDERAYMDTVLNRYDIEPHFLEAVGRSPFDNIDQLTRSLDEPASGPGMYSSAWLCQLAADTGVRVILDGHDGDSTVSHGFGLLEELAKSRRWPELWRHCLRLGPAYKMTAAALFWSYYDSHAVSPVVERVAPLRWIRRIYRGVIRRAHALVGGPKGDREATDDMIQNWDVLSCDSDERLARLKRDVRDERRRQSDVESERMQHFATITQPGHASALEGLDKLCAAAGLEPRYPFFDKRLVEFCLSVPGRLKLRDGWGRWIMRKAMDGILPPEIQWRSDKTDFSDAVCGAAAHEGASELKALMEFDPNQAWPHLNKAAIERLYQHFDRVPTPARYRVLFPVITILAWYRHLKSEHRTSLVVGAKSEN